MVLGSRVLRAVAAPALVLAVAAAATLPASSAEPDREDADRTVGDRGAAGRAVADRTSLPAATWLPASTVGARDIRVLPPEDGSTGRSGVFADARGDDRPPRPVSPLSVGCFGNGSDGKRVRLWYGVVNGQPDRYDQVAPLLQRVAAEADLLVAENAALVGHSRHIRFRTNAPGNGACQARIERMVLPPGAVENTAESFALLDAAAESLDRRLGVDSRDQRDVLMLDAYALCGLAQSPQDPTPGSQNASENQPLLARIDAGCWNPGTLLHELLHTLSVTAISAPNARPPDGRPFDGHVYDVENGDLMVPVGIYGAVPPTDCDQTARFATRLNLDRMDCNNDDYFAPVPRPGSYLAANWNVADSSYFDRRPQPAPHVGRLAGPDRIATAVRMSRDSFGDRAAGGAVLARANDFADALAGTPLALAADGPLLLSATDALVPALAEELRRAVTPGGPVYLLGGRAALGPGVERAVADLGFRPIRLSGQGRFETAAAIAEEISTVRGADAATIWVATGFDFADGLVAGSIAAQRDGVVVLTAGRDLPAVSAAVIADNPDAQVLAIGGDAAAAVPQATALVGEGRFETAQLVAETFFRSDRPETIAVASGLDFPDALAGGAHAARRGMPLLLSDGSRLSPEVRRFTNAIGARADEDPIVAEVVLYGGTAALGEPVRESASYMVRVLPPRVPTVDPRATSGR